MTFETLAKGEMGNGGGSEMDISDFRVIRDEETFREVWGMINPSLGSDSGMPEIDFDEHLILSARMGQQPSSGYEIEILDVIENEETIRVPIQSTRPGRTCVTLTVITSPHHIVKIPRTDREIIFEPRTVVNECD